MKSNTIVLTDWDELFRKELLNIFYNTKQIFLEKVIKNEALERLKSMAFNFYSIFKDSPIPVLAPHPELDESDEIYSTSIMLPFSCFFVPYFFYDTFKENISFDLDYELSLHLHWSELIGIINQKWLEQRKKLTKTEVLICKVLSRYGTQGQIDKFPLTYNIIANRTRKSLSSIIESMRSLFLRIVVNEFFIFNPWKLGFELYLCNYEYSKDEKFNEFDSMTLSKEICISNKAFRIIQQPNHNPKEKLNYLNTLCQNFEGKAYQIDEISFNWDISQLEYREEASFLKEPKYSPFSNNPVHNIKPNVKFVYEQDTVNAMNWIFGLKDLLQRIVKNVQFSIDEIDNDQTSRNLDSFTVNERHLDKIVKVLNYLIDKGIQLKSFEATASYLKLTERELSKIIQFLIKNNIIALAHRFRFIGAGAEYSFIVENGSNELNNAIQQTLLQYPFCYTYRTENLIAGRCQVPSKWCHKFFDLFTRLQINYRDLKISYGQRLLGYNFFTPNVKIPENYILNEFGMQLKH